MGAAKRRSLRAWLGRLAMVVVAIAGLFTLALVGLSASLRSTRVQQAILEGFSERTQDDLGLSLAAEELAVSLLSGEVRLRDVKLRAGDTAPFLTLEEVLVRARVLPSLFGDVDVDRIELIRPSVNLDAPVPAADEDARGPGPITSLPLRIETLRVINGRVDGSARNGWPEPLRELVPAWSVHDLELDGSFDGSLLSVNRLTAGASVARSRVFPLELQIKSSGSIELEGTARLESLEVTGEALELEASLVLRPEWDRSAGWFRLEVDPGVVSRAQAAGVLVAEGEADLAAWEGSVRLQAADRAGLAAGALAADLVPQELAGAARLDATRLAPRADLRLAREAGGHREVTGSAGLVATRDGAVVLDLELGSRFAIDGKLSAQVAAEGRLLPAAQGARVITAHLVSRDALDPKSWLLGSGTIAIDQPRVRDLLVTVADLWPRLLDGSTVAALPDLGWLGVSGTFSGAVRDPNVDVRAELRPEAGGKVEATARGRLLGENLSVRAEARELALGQFAPELAGRVHFAGGIDDPLGRTSGRFELGLRDVDGVGSARINEVGLVLEGDTTGAGWRLATDLGEGARVEGSGRLVPSLPFRSAEGELRWTTGDAALPEVLAFFELVDGKLSAETTALLAAGSPAMVRVGLPLGALTPVPGLERLADLPLVLESGPVTVDWHIESRDFRSLLSASWIERQAVLSRVRHLEGGSSGRLSLDLDCPACSTGSLELTDLSLDLDGRRAVASRALRLVLGDGLVEIEPWSLAGEGLAFGLESELTLVPDWRLGDPLGSLVAGSAADLSASVESSWLEALPIRVSSSGTLELEARVSGPLDGLEGSGTLSAPGLSLTPSAYPRLSLSEPAVEGRIAGGLVEWTNLRLEVNDAELTGEGRARLADPFREASGSIRVTTALPGWTAEVPFEVTDGTLTIAGGRLETAGGEGRLDAELPVARGAGAMARASWSLPSVDWAPLLSQILGVDDPKTLRFATRGSLELPLDRPADARAEIELTSALVTIRGRETVLDPNLEVGVGEGRLRLEPFALRSGTQSFTAQGGGRLRRDWVLTDDPSDLLETFELTGYGDLDAGLLNPFLEGGRAEGSLAIDLRVDGTPASFGGRVTIEGPNASILYRSPYLARLEQPSAEISITDGRAVLERAEILVNEGPLTVSGVLLENGRSDLELELADAVFRLDYGLLATVGGDLRFQLGDDGRSSVAGDLDVERGTLTRNVQLDLDLLSQLLAPIDLTTTEDDPLDLIDLNVAVSTREGVRVKNNLGDLLVRWEPLAVTGTVARPIIEGRLDVDPGGLLYAYGQTVRLDRATIEYPGQEGFEPRLDIEATTSLEDPTIGRLAGDDPFKATAAESESSDAALSDEITQNLARYYGEQVAGRVGESVGVSVSLRPLLIFGETDPGARLTVSRDLSSNFALAASVDLRSAEARTYLLELHELRDLPRLVGQAFTDDQSAFGGALLQRQEFGGTRRKDRSDLPRISKLVVETPKGVSRRGIKRALGLGKGDLFDDDQRFIAEVELVDYLMRRGYPDARVAIRAIPDEERARRVRLEIEVLPGLRVDFRFEGEKIPKPLRRLIQSLYRPDFFEPESIEEMRAETVRALRSRGFLEPRVDIEVETGESGDRLVLVRTQGGLEISQDSPIFLGLPAEDLEVLDVAFANAVQRVELAFGLPSADRRLLSALAALGYPEAAITRRYQSLGERVLTVEIEPGPRLRIAEVIMEGGEADLRPLLEVVEGDPLVRSRLSGSALALERELGARGYLEARVRTVLEHVGGEDSRSRRVRFVVEPGTRALLEDVEFTGLRSTRESYARRVAGLTEDQPLARDDLAEARTRLWRSGLFSGVGTDTIESAPGRERVVFDLEERDRYRLTYGVRWDSEDGAGAVFDATDDNFLGRGWTLGLRALASNEEDSLRWLTRVPRAFGGPGSLELFAAARERTEISTDVIFGDVEVPVDVLEGTLQYSHPVTDRTTVRVYGRYTDTERQLPFFTLRVKNPQLGFQYVFDGRSPGPLTERGVLASVDLSGSEDFLGGDLRYARLFTQFSASLPAGRIGGRRLSWAQAYRVGLAEAFDQELIRDVRFFAGGEYSVRGYETESLGDQERFGSVVEPTGGSALLIINQELRWNLLPDYTLLLFADAGNVWQNRDDLGFSLFKSAGLGLRAVTPIGLVRLDLAHALDRRMGIDPEFKIYFGLGTTF
ncbi:MAG: translocation/assembly module TamB domain-containing protein [Thermoanaerobaculia bacterium]